MSGISSQLKKILFWGGYKNLYVVVLLLLAQVGVAAKPNIIFILTDDLGYGDLNCYGASTNAFLTPRIDQLAAEGIRFTDGHSPTSTCTPSRYSFLTGEYAWRTAGTGIASGVAPLLINPAKVSVPSMLQAAGYATAVVGKWHLGLGSGTTDYNNPPIKPGPLEIGFDYYFGPPATGDRVPCVFIENHTIYNYDPADPLLISYTEKVGTLPTGTENPELLVYYDGGTSHSRTIINGISRIGWMDGVTNAWWRDEDFADIFVEKASAFIEQNTNKPFFLYLSTHDVHVPRAPHERFQGTSNHAWRGDAIHSMDWTVGAIIDKLEELNLTTNTLVIFTSDNGPAVKDGYNDGYPDGSTGIHGSDEANGPFRGGKYSSWEGGTRVPFIVRWPGTVPSNTISSALLSQTDMLATFATLTGQALPTDAGPDSENVLAALLGLSESGRVKFAQSGTVLREGDWKYRKGELYDLTTDIAEATNIAAGNPGKTSEMAAQLERVKALSMKSSILAWWPLNEGNPTNAFDRALNGHDGTLLNFPTPTTQNNKTFLAFDGVDDTIAVTNLPSINDSVTLACWARSRGETWNATGGLMARRPQFALSPVQGTRRIGTDFYSSTGTKQTLEFDLAGLAEFNLTHWHHYAATYNASTGEARLFVDGVPQTNATWVAGALPYSTGTLTLGSDGGAAGSFFEGDLADVRIYDQVMTDQRMANMASARLLDADADMMLDDWEVRFRLNPFDATDALLDTDGDGFTNATEFANNTSPIIPEGAAAGGLLGYWALDDGAGSTATNLAGNSYIGTLNNAPVWSSGAGRNYLQFSSASQQYIEVPGLPSVDGLVTVACWARSGTADWNIAGALVSRRPQWGLHPWKDGKRLSFMINTGTYADIYLDTLPGFDLTEWHHYAGTYDAGTGQAKIYVDGLFAGSKTISAGLLNETTGSLWIGRDSTKARYFEGALDEVRLYNQVLGAAEIMELTEGFDDDEDGMEDHAERAIINANTSDSLVVLVDVLPNDDFDGDGVSNVMEEKAGTDTTSAADFFRVASIDASGSETPYSIFVEGRKNRTYYLERSTELDEAWTPIYQFGPLATDQLVELFDAQPTNTAAFYKVRLTNDS